MAVAGSPYELTSNMYDCDSALCISRAVTIEAEVEGGVMLDGMDARRVINVLFGGAAELIGLCITRGYADVCSTSALSRTFTPGTLTPGPR